MEKASVCIILPALWFQASTGQQRAVRGAGEKTGSLHNHVLKHGMQEGQATAGTICSPPSLSCTFFLGLFQGSCLLHLLHFSVNFYHPPQCPSQTPRSYLLEGNKLFSPHVFRENKMSSPRPRREKQRRNTFAICEECCDVTSFSAVSVLPKIMSLSQRWPYLND